METPLRTYMDKSVGTLRRTCQNPRCPHGPDVLNIRFNEVAPNRKLKLFCSEECTLAIQKRRRTLLTALTKIQNERETPRTRTPRRRNQDAAITATMRARRRKPTSKELAQWERRIRWELDYLTNGPADDIDM